MTGQANIPKSPRNPASRIGQAPAENPQSSLKRPHVLTFGPAPIEVPASKHFKHSHPGGCLDSSDARVAEHNRGGHGGQEEALNINLNLPHPAAEASQTAKPVSVLEAAASVFARGDEMPHTSTSETGRGPAASSIPIRTSPRFNRRGSDHNDDARPRLPSGAQLFHSVALAEYLQLDDRPTLVVDTKDDNNTKSVGLNLIFANTALRSRQALFDLVRGKSEDPTLLLDLGTPFSDFKAWVLNPLAEADIVSTFPFAGLLWQSTLIRSRLRVIHGRQHPFSPPASGEAQGRPALQQYTGLGTLSSPQIPGRGDSPSPTYFDIPPRTGTQAARTMQKLVTESLPAMSPGSLESTSPVASGDMTYAELIMGSRSPPPDQKAITATINLDVDSDMAGSEVPKGYFDWTRLPLSSSLPSHVQFARGIDWASTSLGPIENWSADLRGMCNLIMASPHPSAMYWGQDHVAIYNEAYILLAGQKHPKLMGSRYRDVWYEIWEALEDVFENAFKNAQATMKDDDCLFILRNGFLEETYFSWSIIPLIGADGAVVGLYNPAFEKTRRKIAERRMLTLREIGERTAAARKVSDFWGLLLEGLEYNEYDAPMVLIYSLNEDLADSDAASSGSSGAASNKICYLEGSLGVPSGHKAAPPTIDMKTSTKGFAPSFRQALTTDRPIVLRVEDGSLEADLLTGIEWRGFGDPSRVVVIAPIHPTTGESTLGFLVMGTNPRRPYDEDYDLFVQLLGRQLATTIASVVLFEDEIKKGERAAQLAAQDRIELNNQLVARTQQAVEAENKFTRMAELAPVGIFIGDVDGKINFVNDAWYNITSFPRDIDVDVEWIKYVVEEDQVKVWDMWKTMFEKRCAVSLEFRFKTPWRDKLGNTGPTWVLTSASPERDDDGRLKRIFGSMTDISAQKFAENLQTRRMEEAVELKRQQERYIDTTSHEMRNPLSAILQCADSITASLIEMREAGQLNTPQLEVLDHTIDSAQTITLCGQHQKRIVDDVLTLSKLDSAMMAVSPIDTQPISVMRKVIKMFEAELKTSDIKMELNVESSYQQMGVDWVRLDPHRLSQVLINLMTNAIKFTTMQEKRVIRMHVAASGDKPSSEDKWRLTYIPSRSTRDKDVTAGNEWGLGAPVYIHFAVQDTGRGLDDLEKKQLFQRFSQASPRTHVTYGGSGLGLFISRELVELQGGEIGVASESGKGSIFAFYVKARMSSGEGEDDRLTADSYVRNGPKPPHAAVTSRHTSPLQGLPSGSIKAAPATKVTLSAPIHILVVEDNLINQKVLATQLRKIGCVVHVANHGGEAIEQICNSKYHRDHVVDGIEIDVVLMDLEMPVMDGQTCARKLREMQNTGELVGHIPVIAVTANARAEQIQMTLKSGIDDVVSKPFRIAELIPKVQDVMDRCSNQAKSASN
ncbi:hypothetical protein A1O1_07314 [Capronia coronata CBS 617.96]|uniref:Sensory transduction histidine kinase n=1 Tax=Capronia coronata CBS 617.96 TaxID=1182541 RepID=W9Y215_9EURO|nr:uncharacterized protein A1O1_07314 [Capronia coronata CBS 617.96]EXJ83690.1 hypothetical protein A1O1_07314 [Capronia coronata CBS 617.96]